ncbi:hypothetical protein [Streptomyces echinatus]|uniref:hypothetical protein n=1 Tax=Streptomyces echinatus TaxID=67293 RepID=UPI003795BE6A
MPAARSQPKPARRLARFTALAATTLALAGGALATAPTASAVGSTACNSDWYYFNGHINTNGVYLRSGPGTKYTARGLLSKGTRTYFYCYRSIPHQRAWGYIKVMSGPNKGVKGWVRNDLNDWW